jgi:SRSO17 transposase
LDFRAVAARHRIDPDRWQAGLDEVLGRIAGRFARVEPRRRARGFLLGLLAGLPRTNCWTIAEHAGDVSPDGMQHLLAQAVWDADAVRDDLRDYVVARLGDPAGVLVVDETGDVKKGTATVGVQRQYTGTAGRIENAQVAVYLTYAAPAGYAFIDRALYLPASWTGDPVRCAAAGIPEETGFATKPALARRMIGAAVTAGVPARWVTGDEVYGADPRLRAGIAAGGLGYVLAVASTHRIVTPAGTFTAAYVAGRVPRHAWAQMSAGAGAKGLRWYDWALIDTIDVAADPDGTGAHWLLIRRSRRTGELAFYRAAARGPVPLAELVRVAGTRWRIEESFQSGKELTGLDEHQVRTWTSWHRWTVLAMLAHAFLSVMTATEPAPEPDSGLIALTRNEIRRLFTAATATVRAAAHHLHWSTWRRRHQARARTSHYQRQQAAIT